MRTQATAAKQDCGVAGRGIRSDCQRKHTQLRASFHTETLRKRFLNMFDVDKLIECVHERPSLWEKSCKEYFNKNVKERAWFDIGQIMIDDWDELNTSQRDENVKEIRNKWRHVRDGYTRYLNQERSGDTASKRKKYVYADSLNFLINSLEKRTTTENVTKGKYEKNENEGRNDDDITGEKNTQPSISAKPLKNNVRRDRNELTTFQEELLKILEQSPKEEEDGDKLYIMSLLGDYRKLDDDEKLDFKMLTLKFFQEVRKKRQHHENQRS